MTSVSTQRLRHWCNNCAGLFLVFVVMLVVVLLFNRASAGASSTGTAWLLGLLALLSLAGWTWTAHQLGARVGEKTLLRPF